jgi:inward rectifier potassium channel
MAQQIKDPGIGEKFNARSGRLMNRDGSFNVRHSGWSFGRIHLFQYLIGVSWLQFNLILFGAFVITNMLYACLYLAMGDAALQNAASAGVSKFWDAVFFSAHTLTTVGYGNIYPMGFAANIVSATEAMTGLLGFAVATGLVYGRFSRPTAKIDYSKSAIVTPYHNINALMFRIANFRSSLLMELHADVTYTYVEKVGDQFIRKYYLLPLERNNILYLSLSWTLVHPINEHSPLFNKTHKQLEDMKIEILVKLKGYDEGYGEHVHARFSYLLEDIVWGARFLPTFYVADDGATVLDYNKISSYQKAELNPDFHAHVQGS